MQKVKSKTPWNKGCIEDLQKLAKSKGGECLSKRYVNNHTKYKWKCNKGHVFERLLLSIKRGSWCPICNKYEGYWLGKKRDKKTIKKMTGKFEKGNIPWNKGIDKEEFLKHFNGGKMWNDGKKIPKISGKNNYNWKGGKIIQEGYVYVLCRDHPRAKSKKGYVAEHVLVMEKHLGRLLKKSEVVHHLNENKKDNKISNLMLFNSNSEHMIYHGKMWKKNGN